MRTARQGFPEAADRPLRCPEKGTAAVFAFDDSGRIVSFPMARDSSHHHITGVCETGTRLCLHSNDLSGAIAYKDKQDIPN